MPIPNTKTSTKASTKTPIPEKYKKNYRGDVEIKLPDGSKQDYQARMIAFYERLRPDTRFDQHPLTIPEGQIVDNTSVQYIPDKGGHFPLELRINHYRTSVYMQIRHREGNSKDWEKNYENDIDKAAAIFKEIILKPIL